LEIENFLEHFIKKEVSVKEGRKNTLVKVYYCPKCEEKGRRDGTFTNPINFLVHLIQYCPDFTEYMKDAKIFNFLNGKDLNTYLVSMLREVQGIITQLGVKI
jgi:hypothetical protein